MKQKLPLFAALFALVIAAVAAPSSADDSADAVASLKTWLAKDAAERPPLAEQPFAKAALSKEDAAAAKELLWQDHVARIRRERAEEMKAKVVQIGEAKMKFWYKVYGEKPEGGRSLFISMHGGGGAPARVNDQQWENQKLLYQPKEGVYLVPRGPTDTWDLWHQAPVDDLFDRLIENLIVLEDVNPDRVYVMGYSAGGDGVYQVAPRMADRFAAASMMAGHPNESSPESLRNLAFSLHVGGNDSAYNRNKVAAEWKQKLADLQTADPKGYKHWAKIYEGKGHWLDREDAAAVPWMARHTRDPYPTKIVWRQDDVTHGRFYWLALPKDSIKPRAKIVAERDGQTITLRTEGENEPAENAPTEIIVRLNDAMEGLDLDQPLTIDWNGKVVFKDKARRTIRSLAATLNERGDPRSVYFAELLVKRP